MDGWVIHCARVELPFFPLKKQKSLDPLVALPSALCLIMTWACPARSRDESMQHKAQVVYYVGAKLKW